MKTNYSMYSHVDTYQRLITHPRTTHVGTWVLSVCSHPLNLNIKVTIYTIKVRSDRVSCFTCTFTWANCLTHSQATLQKADLLITFYS